MASRRQFRHEDIASVPRGWKVRTVRRGAHEIRVAFPPGRRQTGSGRLISILHPKAENNPQCIVSQQARKNPSELLIFGNPSQPRVELYTLRTGTGGHIRKATKVIFPDGREVKFMDRLSKREAIRQAREGRNPSARDLQRQARERSARIRGARLNEGHAEGKAKEFIAGMRDGQAGRPPASESSQYRAGYKVGQDKRRGNPFDSYARKHLSKWIKENYRGRERSEVRRKILRVVKEYPEVLESPGARSWPEILRMAGQNPRRRNEDRPLFDAIRAGSKVTFVDRFGQQRTGRAVMKGPHGWVLNMGGRHGTPQVVHADMVTRVRNGNPSEKEKEAAARAAKILETKGYQSFLDFLGSNLARHEQRVQQRKLRRNPDRIDEAVQLYETFHGKSPREVIEKHVSAAMRHEYAVLGDLIALGIGECSVSASRLVGRWEECNNITFESDRVKLAGAPDGRQLYFIGGNQNLDSVLSKWEGIDPKKDFIDLGDCSFVVYEARKAAGNFEPIEWVHKFGEEGGTLPRLMYDKLKKNLFLIGGQYTVAAPGIEN